MAVEGLIPLLDNQITIKTSSIGQVVQIHSNRDRSSRLNAIEGFVLKLPAFPQFTTPKLLT